MKGIRPLPLRLAPVDGESADSFVEALSRRYRGILHRPARVDSHRQKLVKLERRYPADIRAAVEGSLRGWHRLNRFQIAMAFPSVETAAAFLGAHQSALVHQFQHLETDIGDTLFIRSAFGRPHWPTPRGRQLLKALNRPHIKALMDATLGDQRHEFPDQAVVEKAVVDAATRKLPGPLKPFDGIDVERIINDDWPGERTTG